MTGGAPFYLISEDAFAGHPVCDRWDRQPTARAGERRWALRSAGPNPHAAAPMTRPRGPGRHALPVAAAAARPDRWSRYSFRPPAPGGTLLISCYAATITWPPGPRSQPPTLLPSMERARFCRRWHRASKQPGPRTATRQRGDNQARRRRWLPLAKLPTQPRIRTPAWPAALSASFTPFKVTTRRMPVVMVALDQILNGLECMVLAAPNTHGAG